MKFKSKKIAYLSFLGSLGFASALWFYTSLTGTFKEFINVPFYVELPANRGLEKQIQKSIAVEVIGNGWNLFNLYFFNNFKNIKVDLRTQKLNDSIYIISKNEILKSANYFDKVNLSMVVPEEIEIKTGAIATYSIPIKPNIEIKPKKGFSIVGDLVLYPNKVKVTGNEKLLKNLKFWTTKFEKFRGKNSSFNFFIDVADSLKNMVSIEPKRVEVFAEIQQTAEISFDDIEISYRGGSLPKNHYIYPGHLSVSVRGGINSISDLSADKISASLDFASIIEDSTGILIPKIELPNNLEIIKVDPPVIYHYIKTKVDKIPN